MIARPSSLLACLLLVLSVVQAVKFQLPSERNPKPSESSDRYCSRADDVEWYVCAISTAVGLCDVKLTDSIWNFAAKHSLVIVTANSPYEPGQRVDIEILDESERGNVYLSKKVCHHLLMPSLGS